MKLNIYEDKKIVKTYTADAYDIPFGVIEDVASAVNLDSLDTGSDVEIIKLVAGMVFKSMDTIKVLLKDIFDGLTDDEIRKATVPEIAVVIVEIVKYTINQLSLGGNSKNLQTGLRLT